MKPDELVRKARKLAWIHARASAGAELTWSGDPAWLSYAEAANSFRDLADALEESQKDLATAGALAEMNYDRDVTQEEAIKKLEEDLQQVKGEVRYAETQCPKCGEYFETQC